MSNITKKLYQILNKVALITYTVVFTSLPVFAEQPEAASGKDDLSSIIRSDIVMLTQRANSRIFIENCTIKIESPLGPPYDGDVLGEQITFDFINIEKMWITPTPNPTGGQEVLYFRLKQEHPALIEGQTSQFIKYMKENPAIDAAEAVSKLSLDDLTLEPKLAEHSNLVHFLLEAPLWGAPSHEGQTSINKLVLDRFHQYRQEKCM